MNHEKLKRLIIMALCCDLGLFTKKLIAPAVNVITDSLHVPGGIGTSFSIMFLVVAAALMPKFWSGTIMGAVQSVIALSFGMVGSMGVLSPIGYMVPGLVIDLVLFASRKFRLGNEIGIVGANMLAAAAACLTANCIVFHLRGIVLLLYVSIALTSGTICGILANTLFKRLSLIIKSERREENRQNEKEHQNHNPCPCSTCTCNSSNSSYSSYNEG